MRRSHTNGEVSNGSRGACLTSGLPYTFGVCEYRAMCVTIKIPENAIIDSLKIPIRFKTTYPCHYQQRNFDSLEGKMNI